MLVHIIYFIFVANGLQQKSNNFCMFKLCFSLERHRKDEGAGRGARTYEIFRGGHDLNGGKDFFHFSGL